MHIGLATEICLMCLRTTGAQVAGEEQAEKGRKVALFHDYDRTQSG